MADNELDTKYMVYALHRIPLLLVYVYYSTRRKKLKNCNGLYVQYVCHAEVNAILNKNSSDVEGCSIYVGLFPCNECAKMIIQSGIKEVVYLSDKYKETNAMIASRRMFTMAGVQFIIVYIEELINSYYILYLYTCYYSR